MAAPFDVSHEPFLWCLYFATFSDATANQSKPIVFGCTNIAAKWFCIV